MSRRSEAVSPYQVRFDANFSIVQPRLAEAERPDLAELQDLLPNIKLWSDRPNGDCFVIDIAQSQGSVVDPEAWVVRRDFFGEAPVTKETFAGAIVLSDTASPGLVAVEKLAPIVAKLKHQAPFLLWETRGENTSRPWRVGLMRQAGLVQADVLVSHPTHLLWRGRTPKKIERHAVNLIASLAQAVEPWKRILIPDKIAKVKQAYATLGYVVVNTDPIIDQLTHTRYVPRDSASLDFGFGVTVRSSHCDCTWQVDLRGTTRLMHHCDDHECDGQPPPRLTKDILQQRQAKLKESNGKFPLFHVSKTVELPKYCRDHNTPFLQSCRIINDVLQDGMVRIQVDRWCPHCGDPTTQKVRVYDHQLIR